MDGIKGIRDKIAKKINPRETCPGCGNRMRYPEHPLCPRCNEQYSRETATALAEGNPILSRVLWAKERGEETLQRLKEKLAEEEEKEKREKQPVWNESHQQIQAELWQQGKRVDTRTYNRAVGMRFEKLWNVKEKNRQLSRQVYGLRKAIGSLGKFLANINTEDNEQIPEDEQTPGDEQTFEESSGIPKTETVSVES